MGLLSLRDTLLPPLKDSVAERSNGVNSKLQQRREHIEELNRVRSLLKKLQVVFDLPKRLRAAIKIDALEIAVEQYSAALPVLKRFGHQVRGASRFTSGPKPLPRPTFAELLQTAVPTGSHLIPCTSRCRGRSVQLRPRQGKRPRRSWRPSGSAC